MLNEIVIKGAKENNLKNIDFIKLDCEGYEWPAIHGGIRTIRENRPVISIEQKQGVLNRYDQNQHQYRCLKFLTKKLKLRNL